MVGFDPLLFSGGYTIATSDSGRCFGLKTHSPAAARQLFQGRHMGPHPDRAPLLERAVGGRLPHHARSLARIAEGVDERLDRLLPVCGLLLWEQRIENRGRQGKPFNPLGSPVGRNFTAAHPPDFFGVGLKEDAEQPLAKLVRDPVLESPRVLHGKEPGMGIRRHAPGRLNQAEVSQGLARLERIGVVFAAVIDPR